MIEVVSLAISEKRGMGKHRVQSVKLLVHHGIKGDAHAGPWHRQISFLASEAMDRLRENGCSVDFGDLAENISTRGIDWPSVSVGSIVRIGEKASVEITQIGKKCHGRCAIYHKVGDCVMPRQGVFGRVICSGTISTGDRISIIKAVLAS